MNSNLYVIKKFAQSSIICLENTKVLDCLFLVKSGKVEKRMSFYEKEDVEILHEGDTFGFISSLTGTANIERITTLTDCEVIQITRDNIIPFVSQKKEIFLKIIKYYSNKLRKLDKLYKELSNKKESEDYSIMIEAIEYFHREEMIEQRNYAFHKYNQYSKNEVKKEMLKKKFSLENAHVADIEERSDFSKQDIIFLEHEEGKCFYFIEKGKVKISHVFNNKEVILCILGEGEFFGEMAILNKKKRMASAIAFQDCHLMVLHSNNFIDKLGDKILEKIFVSLAKRLYHTYRRVKNLHFKNPVSRLYDCIDYLVCTGQGITHEKSFHFYFALEELKRMADIQDAGDKDLGEFLYDKNIRFNYGEMVIIDIDLFNLKLRKFTGIDHE